MEKKTSHPLESTHTKNPLLRIYLLIGFVAAVTVGSVAYVSYVGNHMVAGHVPLIGAAMEIKIEATMSHLWLEEIISGDHNESIDDVLEHIDQADWYARAMLEGGERAECRFVSLNKPRLRQEIVEVREKLDEFRMITRQRWQARETAGIGSELDEQYDSIFREFVAQVDFVETHLQQQIRKELTTFHAVQALLAAVCLSVTVIVGLAFGRFVRRRMRDEMGLRAANQQLVASEQELRREKDRVQKYLDVAAVMLVAIDCEQRVDLINKKGCEILGYDESEILGKNWFDCFLPERLGGQVKDVFEGLMAGEMEPVEYYENPVLTKDGRERLISWHNTVLRDDEGRIVYTLTSGEDITERKRAEEGLRQYEHIVSTSSDMLAFLDNRFTYLAANEAYLKAFKLTRQELIGHTVSEVFGEESFAEVIKPNAERCLTGQEVNYQAWFDFPAYRRRYMDVTYYPYRGADNEIDGFVVNARNVTKRKQAEEQLRQKDYIIESASSAIATGDLDGKLTYANPAFLEMWGFDNPDEFLGKPLTEYWMVADKLDEIMDTLRNDGTWTDENQARRRDGSVFDVQVSAALVRDREGNPVSMMSSSVDITERKRAEEALRESESRLQQIADTIDDVFWMTDWVTHKTIFASRAYEQVWGRSRESLYADAEGWADAIHPEDRQRAWDVFVSLGKGESYSEEYRVVRPDGSVRWILDRGVPVHNEQGEIYRVIGIAQDITERKRAEDARATSEQRLELAHDAAGMGMFDWDIVLDKAVCNERYFRLFGLEPQDRMLSREDWSAMVHPDDRHRAQEEVRQTLEERAPYDTEYRVVWPDGSVMWVSSKAKVFYDDDGRPYRMIGAMTDITGRKKSEEEVERIFNMTGYMVCVADLNGYFRRINSSFEQTLGYSSEELLARPFFDFIHPDDRDKTIAVVEEQLSAGVQVIGFENRYRCKDGSYKWLSWTSRPVAEEGIMYAIAYDITDRKQAQDAIRESEEQLSLIYNTTTDIMFLLSVEPEGEFRIVSHNQAFDRLMAECGLEQGTLDGVSLEEFFRETLQLSPEDVAYRLEKEREAASTREVVRFELTTNLPNVGEVVHDTTLHPVVNQQNECTHILVGIENITERRQAQEKLREKEKHYRTMIESSHEIIFSKDRDGRYHSLNLNAAVGLGGTCIDDVAGKTDYDLLPSEQAAALQETDKKAMESGQTVEAEEVVSGAQGQERTYLSRKWPTYDDEGKISGIGCFAVDITEHKRAEAERARLTDVLETTSDFVSTSTPDGELTYLNRAGKRMLGWPEDEAFDGRKIPDAHPDWAFHVVKNEGIPAAIKHGIWEGETALLRSDGTEIPASQVIMAHKSPNGEVEYLSTIIRDITERNNREKELAEYRNQLRSLVSELTIAEDRERKNIASLLHDDVLQKLALSKMKLSMLRETLTSNDQIGALDNIHDYVSEMFSDMRALTFDLCPPILYDIGLEAAVRDWLQKEMVEKYGIAANLETRGQPLHLREDVRVALYRAIREVLMNVIKHARAQKVNVMLAHLGGAVRVEVRDDGVGFERARAEAGSESSGGLGLFTVRERLEYFGGSLETESTPGEESRVILTAALTSREQLGREPER